MISQVITLHAIKWILHTPWGFLPLCACFICKLFSNTLHIQTRKLLGFHRSTWWATIFLSYRTVTSFLRKVETHLGQGDDRPWYTKWIKHIISWYMKLIKCSSCYTKHIYYTKGNESKINQQMFNNTLV